jgi:hypothetical protein
MAYTGISQDTNRKKLKARAAKRHDQWIYKNIRKEFEEKDLDTRTWGLCN